MSHILGRTIVSSLALRCVLFIGVAVCAQLAGPALAGVIYVKHDAAGADNGQSWSNAYTDLQAALTAAVSGDEIWVAKGTYKPTTGTLRTVSFEMKQSVALYGGFAGAETERGQRNWEANAAILSGDIGTPGDNADNTYRVVAGARFAVLDGFTITGGNGSSGCGMFNSNCSPTIANCTFTGNNANSSGGSGAGMYNYNGASPTITNCTFTGNTAWQTGAGMYNRSTGSPIVINCTFSGNAARVAGGGMHNENCSPIVTNCAFTGNTGDGGGMYNDDSLPTVTRCIFSGNTANASGGGMYNYSTSSPDVTSCTFSGNAATYGGGVYNASGSSLALTNSTFTGNTAAGNGGGMYSHYTVLLTLTNCTLSSNTAASSGGGMYNSSTSPTLTNCISWDNNAPAGAEVLNTFGTPTFSHCNIKGSGGSGASWDSALGADGGGNIAADPRFVAPATPVGADGVWLTGDDGLRLRSGSPCIRAADPAVAPEKDILGLRRKTAPDIGAYESFPASTGPAWLLFR
jgi:predicted outer membrane repeat protein